MANCPHGFPEGQCLICQTLGVGRARSGTPVTASGKVTRGKEVGTLLAQNDLRASLPVPADVHAPARRRRRGGGKVSVLTGLAVVVVGGLLVWAFAGLFVLAFHIFEYAALALVAGWLGYKLGHARGRRERRST